MSAKPTSAQVAEMADRYGWADALEQIAAEAPPVPDEAVVLLKANGFPARKLVTSS